MRHTLQNAASKQPSDPRLDVWLPILSFFQGGWRSSTTTTTVIDSKNGDVVQLPARSPKKTVTDNLYTTFSSPLAWILVLALIITWSAVAVIMFDLLDQKQLTGPHPPGIRKAIKEIQSPRGNIHHMGSDPMKSVGKAVEESTSWANGVLAFITDLLSPDEDEGISHTAPVFL
uniref:Triadin n=1 Tax=Paramormyrops kingsleyae TaxID=1676925 RepID=A0A3B3SSB1_9TELE